MPKQRPGEYQRSHDATVAPALADLGISKTDSSRWQRVANVPEETFEAHVAEVRQAEGELTTEGVLRLAKDLDRRRRVEEILSTPCLTCGTADLDEVARLGVRFGVIYADPPWKYENQATRGSTAGKYPPMSMPDILALGEQVRKLAAPDCHRHLWATNAFFREAFRVMEAWGFEYKDYYTWCKPPPFGTGNYWRNATELCLLGVRGSCTFIDHSLHNWDIAPRGEHSAKPGIVRRHIEKASPRPRLELFGRECHEGWVVWGNQISRVLFYKSVEDIDGHQTAPEPAVLLFPDTAAEEAS
jgi:N6-adenosine-specific RNA methylase IME4